MKRRTAQLAVALLLVAAFMITMTTVAGAQVGPGMGRGFGMGPGWPGGGPGWWGGNNPASTLNLTDAQKQKTQSIFDSAYRQMQALRDQMYEKRTAYWTSQKPLSDAEIDKLATERAALMAKMQATRDKAYSNFYNNVLTAEQRAKYDQLGASAGDGPGFGRRGFCWRGSGW